MPWNEPVKADQVERETTDVWTWHCPQCNRQNQSRRYPGTNPLLGKCGTCHQERELLPPDDPIRDGRKRKRGAR